MTKSTTKSVSPPKNLMLARSFKVPLSHFVCLFLFTNHMIRCKSCKEICFLHLRQHQAETRLCCIIEHFVIVRGKWYGSKVLPKRRIFVQKLNWFASNLLMAWNLQKFRKNKYPRLEIVVHLPSLSLFSWLNSITFIMNWNLLQLTKML